MARKTVSVEQVRDWTNAYLANTRMGESRKQMRLGAASLLETVLHETGNYRGFVYIGGYRPNDPDFDDSRRNYY